MFIPKEELSAYERWELGSLAEPAAKPKSGATTGAQAPQHAAVPEAELARIRAEAREAGLKEGRAQARQEVERLAKAAAQAEALAGQEAEQLAAEVLDLALELARQMVRTELKVRRETLLAVVREALDCLPHATTGAQLQMNPADVDLVRAHAGEELKAGAVRLVEDHRIEPGGCRIVSAACEVDATLATRWKRLVATLGVDHNWLDQS
ncbi:MAG TPA: FliH/SctL family protein [Burkholderiales bacterium]|nr:FliH/SctL family protein [Burkholderiales bacterium]